MVLASGYNMKIPPITTDDQRNIVPVQVRISIILMKIVQIKEVDHKIEFQFGIVLEWPEIRALFHNLKFKSSLNALTDEEISQLWLPYVIYDNTDMKEVVQLEEGTKTTVTVTRQGDFTRSGVEVADEIEVFEGGENKLTMNQTYSKKFQCEYQLHRYPFDIQVVSSLSTFCDFTVQVCSIRLNAQPLDVETMRLVPGKVSSPHLHSVLSYGYSS